jgi:hypothetical protein
MKLPSALVEAVDMMAASELLSRTSWVTRALLDACHVDERESVEARLEALQAKCEANLAKAQELR